jgi:putative CocE/NonD family hydrolase
MPAQTKIVMERNVPATMRDGCVLYSDVYRPADDLRHPVLLQRIPYGKGFLPFATYCLDVIVAAHAGYVVIVQDVRGRFESEGGLFYLYRDEFADGYDTVEWAASLPHSDGNVGMFGASYMGMTQWQAAVMRPPHLKAIFPCTAASGAYFYTGGAVEWGLLSNWTLTSIGPAALLRALPNQPEVMADLVKLAGDLGNIESVFETLPLAEVTPKFAPWMREILEHDEYDEFHRRLSVRGDQHREVEVPAFVFAGWYDCLIESDLQHFSSARSMGATEVARKGTRLMVGPWAHAAFWQAVGERNFGPAASGLFLKLQTDLTSLQLRWFDRWLRGIKNGIDEQPPVELFVMGQNRWRSENEWPLARTKYTPWYLHPNRGLGPAPAAGAHEDAFAYDPRNPVPTRGGNHLLPAHYPRGPVDQREVEARADVMTYTSLVLERDLEVTGPVAVKLWAASSAPSTDFTAKLVDVFPDGRAFNVCDGIVRVKQGAREPREHSIELWATSNAFLRGHRVRVEISSSNFPRFDRNLNTGLSGRDSGETAVANQTVFCGGDRASCVVLPVIE